MPDVRETLIRPVESRTNTHWESRISTITIEDAQGREENVTGFQWFLRSNTPMGLVGGDVFVLPDRGVIVFRDRREEPRSSQDPEDVLRKLDEYGWGEPPNFDEVCGSINRFKQMTGEGTSAQDALNAIVDSWKQIEGVTDDRGAQTRA